VPDPFRVEFRAIGTREYQSTWEANTAAASKHRGHYIQDFYDYQGKRQRQTLKVGTKMKQAHLSRLTPLWQPHHVSEITERCPLHDGLGAKQANLGVKTLKERFVPTAG